MIDVVFQLVVFFMVSSTFVMTPGLNLDLPESTADETITMTRVVISVAGPEELYLNDERYDIEGLSAALSDLAEEEGEEVRSIVVEGDSGVRYELMVRVLDVLRQNGFRGASLRTREPEPD